MLYKVLCPMGSLWQIMRDDFVRSKSKQILIIGTRKLAAA
jgi:hypothetical protein